MSSNLYFLPLKVDLVSLFNSHFIQLVYFIHFYSLKLQYLVSELLSNFPPFFKVIQAILLFDLFIFGNLVHEIMPMIVESLLLKFLDLPLFILGLFLCLDNTEELLSFTHSLFR
jgi:hypothetical protein